MKRLAVGIVSIVFFALLTACSSVVPDPTEAPAQNSEAVLEAPEHISSEDWEKGQQGVLYARPIIDSDGLRYEDQVVTITITTTDPGDYADKLCVGESKFPMVMASTEATFQYHGLLIEAYENGLHISMQTKYWDEEKQHMSEATHISFVGDFETTLPWEGIIEIKDDSGLWSTIRLSVSQC